MAHPSFDIDAFRSLAPGCLGDVYQSLFVDSPCSIIVAEHYRQLAMSRAEMGPFVPTDRFTLAAGEPPQPHLTKVNGLPYRPSDKPWPVDREGRPMVFLAQVCFADSGDHIGATPGEVLLIFMHCWPPARFSQAVPRLDPSDDEAIVFEWHSIGIHNPATWADVPKPPLVFPTCHGVRYRTVDYIDDVRASQAMNAAVSNDRLPPGPSAIRDWTIRGLYCYPQLKIGGRPFWYSPQGPQANGRFLCSFSSVNLSPNAPYPWVNQVDSIDADTSMDSEHFLIFRDGCILNYFLRDDESVEWQVEAV